MNTNGKVTGSKPVVSGLGKLFIAVVEDKGGVGKSVICDIVHAGFSHLGKKVGLIDIDGSNSVGCMQHADAIFADTSDEGWQAAISKEIRGMMSPEGLDVLILDSGARDGVRFQAELHGFASKMSRVGGRMLVIRPVTTNIFTQENAAQFAIDTQSTDVAVVTMEVRAQGRTEKHFLKWQNSGNYKAAGAAGAVPTFVKNLGIEFMDDAVACRLSIGDIANENFSKPTAHKRSRELFDDTSVVWAQDKIEEQMEIWLPAFRDALKKRENGNGQA